MRFKVALYSVAWYADREKQGLSIYTAAVSIVSLRLALTRWTVRLCQKAINRSSALV